MALGIEVKDTGASAVLARLLRGKDADRAMTLAINRTGEEIQRRHRANIQDRFDIRTPNAKQFLLRLVKWKRATTRTLTGTLLIEGPLGKRGEGRARAKVLTRHEQGDRFSGTAFIGGREFRQAGKAIPRSLYPTAVGFATIKTPDQMPYLARGRGSLGGRTGADTAPRNRSQGKRRTFLMRSKKGDTLLVQRTSKTNLRVLWYIERGGTKVKPTLRFERDASRLGRVLLPREMDKAVRDVIRFGLTGR